MANSAGRTRIQENGEQIVQARRCKRGGNFKGVRRVDWDALVEIAVASHALAAKALDGIVHLERRVALEPRRFAPRRLAGRVVGHFILEEDDGAVVAVPDDLMLLVVFDEETVHGDVIAIDDDTRLGRVMGPADAMSVVGSPG